MVPDFKEIRILPDLLGDLDHAAASILTVYGTVSSAWQREAHEITLTVSIPTNCRDSVGVPKIGLSAVTVTEGEQATWKNGRYVAGVRGITSARESDDRVIFEIGSGSYTFRLTGDRN